MKRYIAQALTLALLISVLCGCRSQHPRDINLRLRATVDSYNKISFVNRYNDPSCAIHEAYDALDFLRDSLPQYTDGRLRAYNNLAFEYYMLAEPDSSKLYIDSVLSIVEGRVPTNCKNAEVERVIAQLTLIRLLQRTCRIADSYQLLYDIDQSAVLNHSSGSYLYAFAQMEYYITSLTLNYH